MPNWVYNSLTAQGPHDSIAKMKEQLNKPFIVDVSPKGDLAFSNDKQVTYSNPVFSFWNIIAPTDLEAYREQPVRSELGVDDPNWWNDLQEKAKTDDSWYNWNIRNWGVKWDVAISDNDKFSDTSMEETEDEWTASVHYNFNTAWGVADEALTKLSSQYPDILFTLSFEEETGWGGEWEFLRGEIISQSEYGWKCRECDNEEDDTPWCDDCEFDICPSCGYNESSEPCDEHKEKDNA